MTPQEMMERIERATVEELCHQVIWDAVMAGTAHSGWTDRARDGLVSSVQSSVSWALARKGIPIGPLYAAEVQAQLPGIDVISDAIGDVFVGGEEKADDV